MGISLATKAEYKAYVGITSTTQDTIIDSLLPKISALVKTVCRRSFVDYVEDAKIEIHEGGSPFLAIQSLEMSIDYGETYEELFEYTDYVFTKKDGLIRPIGLSEFTLYPNGYKVTYTAGFEEIPLDLKLAVLDLVTYYIKNDGAIHSNKAPGTNTVQIEYVTTTNLPAHIKRVLDQYADNYN